jgi:uncharacterized protein (TIGR03437 family)
VQVAVTQVNGHSLTTTVPVVATNPSIFAANGTGTGQGAILNADLSHNSASNPTPLGSVISIFATGLGVTNPASVDGVLTSVVNPPLVAQRLTVTIGGQSATVLYQGAAPGQVAGVSQINVQIPSNIQAGRRFRSRSRSRAPNPRTPSQSPLSRICQRYLQFNHFW